MNGQFQLINKSISEVTKTICIRNCTIKLTLVLQNILFKTSKHLCDNKAEVVICRLIPTFSMMTLILCIFIMFVPFFLNEKDRMNEFNFPYNGSEKLGNT